MYGISLWNNYSSLQVPIDWDVVDVRPVKLENGKMGIPPSTIEAIKKSKIGLKGLVHCFYQI
jgi:hypothetical protein